MRAHAPRSAKLRPRRRDDEEPGLCAALAQGPQNVDRRRVGPLQILEGEHDRLRARPRQYSGDDRRQLPPAHLFRRLCRRASRRQWDTHQRREQRRIFGRVEVDEAEGVFEIRQALLGREIRVESLASPFSDRMKRSVLQELRRRPFDECVRRLAQSRVELLQEPRLAETGLADDQRELPVARPRALPAAREKAQLLVAADVNGVSVRAPLRRPPPLARMMR